MAPIILHKSNVVQGLYSFFLVNFLKILLFFRVRRIMDLTSCTIIWNMGLLPARSWQSFSEKGILKVQYLNIKLQWAAWYLPYFDIILLEKFHLLLSSVLLVYFLSCDVVNTVEPLTTGVLGTEPDLAR